MICTWIGCITTIFIGSFELLNGAVKRMGEDGKHYQFDHNNLEGPCKNLTESLVLFCQSVSKSFASAIGEARRRNHTLQERRQMFTWWLGSWI